MAGWLAVFVCLVWYVKDARGKCVTFFLSCDSLESWKLCSVGVRSTEKLFLSTQQPIRWHTRKKRTNKPHTKLYSFCSFGSFALLFFPCRAVPIVHDIFRVCLSVEIRAPIDSHVNLESRCCFACSLCVSLYIKKNQIYRHWTRKRERKSERKRSKSY